MGLHTVEAHQFELDECIGTGGYGVVYRARMTSPNGLVRVVAVKALRPDVVSVGAVARLQDEARLLAALQHRAVLAVHDLVRFEGRVALVSEYIEGSDLAELIEEAGGSGPVVPVRVAVHITAEVASALAAAWSAPLPQSGAPMNLVHRDIKPANIRVSTGGEVKLLDFGIARSDTIGRSASTHTGLLVGTIGYLAPDRFVEEAVQPSADVYALGLVLYELLTGRRMYLDVGRVDVMRMAIDPKEHERFVQSSLASLGDVPGPIVDLLRQMLHPEHTRRPSAAAVEARAEALVEAIEGPSIRQWARERTWRPERTHTDGWVGATVTASGMLDKGAMPPDAPLRSASPGSDGGEAPVPPVARPSAGRPRVPRWSVVAVMAVLLGLGAMWSMGDVGDRSAVPERKRVPVAPVTEGLTDAPPPAPEAPLRPAPEAAAPAAVGGGGAADPAEGGAAPGARPEPRPDGQSRTGTPSPEPAATEHPPDGAPSSEARLVVKVSSFPFGAAISSDEGRLCAQTPCDVELAPGTHALEWTLPDGRTHRELVVIDREHQQLGHRFAPR